MSLQRLAIFLCLLVPLRAANSDSLVFTNGEKLIGKLLRSAGSSVMFHSDMLGDLTIDWSKIKELHSTREFVVVPHGEKLDHGERVDGILRGSIDAEAGTIHVAAGQIAIKDAGYIVDEAAFQNAIRPNPYFLGNWTGVVNAGASLVEATQTSRSFTGTVHLARAIPAENWLDPSNRTLANFSASYGKLDQPHTPTLKTEIFHLDLERDEYFSPRLYGFGLAAFDHSFSQGLDLQQSYGGGIGWTVIKNTAQALDLKASANYLSQKFQQSSLNQNLFGSVFAETYRRGFAHGVIFNQQLSVTPAWNNLNAYSAAGNAGIAMPVYKRVSLSISAVDAFINDPPPGFRKNSFQFTTGAGYTFK